VTLLFDDDVLDASHSQITNMVHKILKTGRRAGRKTKVVVARDDRATYVRHHIVLFYEAHELGGPI
jgi:hypothetical protein